jgi:protocatechuate 3,4-dioxygenase beta subunit
MKIYLKSLYFIIVIIILCLSFALMSIPAQAVPSPGPVTTGQIWGRALMPDGATGIPGCEVQLLWKDDQLLAKSTSDADGNFYFTLLQPNDDTWSYRLVVKRGAWGQSVTQQFSVMADSATNVQVRVYPYIGGLSLSASNSVLSADGSSRVTVTVGLVDMNGSPVPDGVHVKFTQGSVYPNPGVFYTGATNGTDITLATQGGKVQVQYGDVPGDTLSRNVQITATCDESSASKTLNLTIDLVNPNVIRGTVYDATGRPVPFAKIFLYRWDGVKFAGYNSTETGDRTDGSGICDGNGSYRFAVIPAGDYRVNATESTFTNSSRVTLVRGTYDLDLDLPMGRGSIRGWVKDNRGEAVPGATVSLLRFYGRDLSRMATNTTAADGSFGFGDVWYGKYDVQAVYANQTADLPLVLDENRTSVTLTLLHDVPAVTPGPSVTHAPANATVTPGPRPTATITPRPPTPTPPPVTPSYLVSSYGVAIAVMVLISAALLLITLRMRPK